MTVADSPIEAVEDAPAERLPARGLLSRVPSLALAVILLAAVTALNWPYQFTSASVIRVGSIDSPVDFGDPPLVEPVMAGWPYRFWIRYPNPADAETTFSRFSLLALFYNLALAAGTIALLSGYFLYRRRRDQANVNKISISDLLVLTLLLAAPFGWWQRLSGRAERERQMLFRLQSAGAAYTTAAWVPQVLESRFPSALTDKLRRLHRIRVEHPPTKLVEEIVQCSDLQILRLGGGSYDLEILQRLSGNLHLIDLRIAGRQVDGSVLPTVGALPRLRNLNFTRTSITAESLNALETLSGLESLSLIHSDVELAELIRTPWSQTIRHLWVGHPMPGKQATLKIAGWPNLESLSVMEFDTQANSSPTKVILQDLPALASIELDAFQKFDLELKNLPVLRRLVHNDFEWQARIPRGGAIPGQIWCSRIDIDGAGELKELNFFAPSIQHFRIKNTPKLASAGVGAFYRTYSNATYASELGSEAATALIEGLSKSDGPALIDLDAVPLQGVDLAPLAQNEKITEIKLSASGTNLEQWKTLESMKWLTRFEVLNCPIDGEGVRWALDAFPNLEYFAFSPFQEDEFAIVGDGFALEVIDRPNLKAIGMGNTPMEFFNSVRIVDSPALVLALNLGYLQELELRNAASVTGLAVQGPFPADAELKGLRDLRFLAVGGPAVTDDVLGVIGDCPDLSTLTLAYPSMTAEGLRALQLPAGLSSLHLPGTPLDDAIIQQWPQPQKLTQLDLRDTEVTGQSVRHLCVNKDLSRLVLDRTRVGPGELGFLRDYKTLTELSLVEVGIDAPTLTTILSTTPLRILDLSESRVTGDVLDALASHGHSLQLLGLRNCELDERKLAEVAARNPMLKFELAGLEVSPELMTQWLSRGRVIERDQWEMQLAMEASIATPTSEASYETVDLRESAMVDVNAFARLRDDPQVFGGNVAGPGIRVQQQSPIMVQFGRWLGNTLAGDGADGEDGDAMEAADQTSTPATVERSGETQQ